MKTSKTAVESIGYILLIIFYGILINYIMSHGAYNYGLTDKKQEIPIISTDLKKLTYKEAFIKKMIPIINLANKSIKEYSDYDNIPVSLVLSQCIIESNWGKSRFANEYNNLFGMHEYRKTKKRPIKEYISYQSSVIDYMLLLHRGSHFKRFRELLEITDDSLILADGLHDYSEKKDYYINLVKEVIKDNNLKQYD